MRAIMQNQSKTQIAILYKMSFFREGYGRMYSLSVVHTLLLLEKHVTKT